MRKGATAKYLLLSSGTRPRYLDDVVRALALPSNAELTFRYDKRHVDASCLAEFTDGSAVGALSLLAYIDQSDQTADPIIIPCREAEIIEVADQGVTLEIVLKLECLASTNDLTQFQRDLRGDLKNNLPHWSDSKLVGSWLLPIRNERHQRFSSDNLMQWHAIIEQLSNHREFNSVPAFLKILGVRPPNATRYAKVRNSSIWYRLCGGREYVLDVYHYHPRVEPKEAFLRIGSSNKDLVEIVGTTSAALNSRYDRKRFRIATGSLPVGGRATILLEYFLKSADQSKLQFVIPTLVRARAWKIIVRTVSIGAFVAAPSMVAAESDNKLTWKLAALMLLFGLLAGAASTFSLRKDI